MQNKIVKSNWIILFYLLYALLSIFWGILYYTNESSDYFHIPSLIIFTLFVIIYFRVESILNYKIYCYWLRPSYVLLFSLVVVNLQTILNVILGYEKIGYYLGTIEYNDSFNQVYYLSLLALLSFMCGNISYRYRFNKSRVFFIDKKIYYIWIIITTLSFIMFVLNIDILSFVTGLNYKGSGAYDRVTSNSVKWETLFDTFLTICVTLMTLKNMQSSKKWTLANYVKGIPKILFLITTIYLILRLLSGDRGMALYTLMLYLYSYLYLSDVKIKLRYLIIVVVVGAFTMTLLNYVRGYGSNQSFSEKITRGFNDISSNSFETERSISPLTQELAQSVNCNFISVSDIEKGKTEFEYGKYNLSEILAGIPGSASFSKKMLNIDLYENSTTEYITKSFYGKYYPIGLGTTAIAAIYLDFGGLGVIIIFFLIGVIFKYIDCQFIYKSIFSVVLFILVIKLSSMAIYIPRSSFSWVLSRVIYISLFYLVLNSVFLLIKAKRK